MVQSWCTLQLQFSQDHQLQRKTETKGKRRKYRKISEGTTLSTASPARKETKTTFYLLLILQLLTCGLFNMLSVVGLYIHHCPNNNISKRERERGRRQKECVGAREALGHIFSSSISKREEKRQDRQVRSLRLSVIRVAQQHVLHPPASTQKWFSIQFILHFSPFFCGNHSLLTSGREKYTFHYMFIDLSALSSNCSFLLHLFIYLSIQWSNYSSIFSYHQPLNCVYISIHPSIYLWLQWLSSIYPSFQWSNTSDGIFIRLFNHSTNLSFQ